MHYRRNEAGIRTNPTIYNICFVMIFSDDGHPPHMGGLYGGGDGDAHRVHIKWDQMNLLVFDMRICMCVFKRRSAKWWKKSCVRR